MSMRRVRETPRVKECVAYVAPNVCTQESKHVHLLCRTLAYTVSHLHGQLHLPSHLDHSALRSVLNAIEIRRPWPNVIAKVSIGSTVGLKLPQKGSAVTDQLQQRSQHSIKSCPAMRVQGSVGAAYNRLVVAGALVRLTRRLVGTRAAQLAVLVVRAAGVGQAGAGHEEDEGGKGG